MNEKSISPVKAVIIVIIFTAYFFLLLFTLLPFTKAHFSVNPAVYWFITGYFLFIPLFITALALARIEGNKGLTQILQSLNIRPFSKSDWLYASIGLLLVLLLTGVIFGVSFLLNKLFGIALLSTTPWFMEMHPFEGYDKLLLLVWLPMFFFNIVGENILWRGYIQSRLTSKYAWILCSFLWMFFHIPFGIDLMIMLIPIMIILPFIFSKTRNTLVSIFIHGMFNGPVFIAVALGLLK